MAGPSRVSTQYAARIAAFLPAAGACQSHRPSCPPPGASPARDRRRAGSRAPAIGDLPRSCRDPPRRRSIARAPSRGGRARAAGRTSVALDGSPAGRRRARA
jgi:hypothetical protein